MLSKTRLTYLILILLTACISTALTLRIRLWYNQTESVASNPSHVAVQPIPTIVFTSAHTAQLRIDTSGASVASVDIALTYPTDRLKVESVAWDTAFCLSGNKAISDSGTVTLICSLTGTAKTQIVTVATLTYSAQGLGHASFSISPQSSLTTRNNQKVLLAPDVPQQFFTSL